ncbi:tetratricopeptide repeat-containing sensor histidine kinase [[Flexibacter] sp. ATCC 35103]|uniref:tetratricopeptide repeat-containing sensor histidine kinase n=1 Tax=[Flexibacter] sp. ATCC 35103 TaxID=1937528 RepID=UPI000F50A987|nr:tetratricopeptide repeat-containing sensor histidine kinase [[Flexibacter] sp. ATCC 35103]
MGNIKYLQGDFINSEAILTKTLPYLKKIKKPRYAWYVYVLLGDNYYSTDDYSNSLLYYKKALNLKQSNFKKTKVLIYIAAVYIEQKKYEKAELILLVLSKKKDIYLKDKKLNDSEYARILYHLGLSYLRQGKLEAIDYFNRTLKIQLESEDYDALIETYKSTALFYQNINLKKSKQYAKEAYKISLKKNAISNKIVSLKLLIETSEGAELKKYSQEYLKLHDSFNTAKLKAKNQFARIKYDYNREQEENLQLKAQTIDNELQLERQKNRNFVLYIIISLILSLLTFLYFYLKLKGKKQKNDAIFESDRRISKHLSDELTNDVYQTLTYAENCDFQKDENKEKLLSDLDTIYSRTRNISKEHSLISTDKNYEIALKEMISGFKTPELNIILNGFDLISWDNIEKNKKIILYRVLQELFANMKKHSQATLVSINIKIIDKNLTIIFNDNGVRTKNSTPNFKNGLQNVENRIKTINGNIIFDKNSEKGFRISFSFPL